MARQSAFTFRSDFSFMLEVKDRSEDGACEGRSTPKASLQGALWHSPFLSKGKCSYTHQATPNSPSAGRERASRWFSTQTAGEPTAPCDHPLALFPPWLYLDSTGATLLFIFPTEVWDPSPYFPWAQLKQGSEWFFFFLKWRTSREISEAIARNQKIPRPCATR